MLFLKLLFRRFTRIFKIACFLSLPSMEGSLTSRKVFFFPLASTVSMFSNSLQFTCKNSPAFSFSVAIFSESKVSDSSQYFVPKRAAVFLEDGDYFISHFLLLGAQNSIFGMMFA